MAFSPSVTAPNVILTIGLRFLFSLIGQVCILVRHACTCTTSVGCTHFFALLVLGSCTECDDVSSHYDAFRTVS